MLRRQLLRMLSLALGSRLVFNEDDLIIEAQPAEQSTVPASTTVALPKPGLAKDEDKETVEGIGGLFFRAHDPVALAHWYQQHLGISPAPSGYGQPVWQQEAGPTVFTAFPETSKYFGDLSKLWMVNFRVRNLDKLVAQLRAAGVEVKIDAQNYPNGRFARLHDPEGNPIELWQPAARGGSH